MPTSAMLGLLVGLILSLTGAGGGILAVPLLVFGTGIGVAQAGPIGLLGMLGGRVLATRIGGPALQKGFALLSALVALGMIARTLLA